MAVARQLDQIFRWAPTWRPTRSLDATKWNRGHQARQKVPRFRCAPSRLRLTTNWQHDVADYSAEITSAVAAVTFFAYSMWELVRAVRV